MLFFDWFKQKENFKLKSMVLRLSFLSEKAIFTEVGTNIITVIRGLSSFKKNNKLFNVHGSLHRNNILIYIQQDATLHSLFYLETALHVSGGGTTRNT
jgi:hypothetical protein